MVFSVQGAATLEDEDDDTELGAELLLDVIELELLGREELLAELADEAVTVSHRLPVKVGTSAAAAPFVP